MPSVLWQEQRSDGDAGLDHDQATLGAVGPVLDGLEGLADSERVPGQVSE